jgi:dTDP-4-dehydrorhamnose reductase
MHDITIIGKTGQLGRALYREGSSMGLNINSLNRAACDLSLPATDIEAIIDNISRVDLIIIAAAFTAVDAAETDRELAVAINSVAPEAIGRAAAKRNIPVIHISTDYVFNGKSTIPYLSDDIIEPINFYGYSKFQGELRLRKVQPNSAVLRTSWVYDRLGKNFLTSMLRLAESCKTVNVVCDQIGRPTYSIDLARATLRAAMSLISKQSEANGIFHVSNSGSPISWAEFAVEIFETFQSKIDKTVTVKPIPASSYPTRAARPAWSVLDISNFENTFNHKLPHWKNGLSRAALERIWE